MIKALFNVFFEVINGVISLVLTPLNALVSNFLPDFAIIPTTFNYVINTYLVPILSWFIYLIPPTTWSVIQLYLTLTIAIYTVVISAHAIIKLYTIIQRIKFW